MTHEEAVRLLTDYAAGRLGEAERVEMTRHIDSCDECGGLLETLQILAGAPRKKDTDRAPPAHPAPCDIVEYALARASLPTAERDRLAAHVRDCERCSREVATVAQAESAATTSEPSPEVALVGAGPADGRALPFQRRSSSRLALIAAAIGAAGTTYLGFYRLPQLQSRIESLEAERRQLVIEAGKATRLPAPPEDSKSDSAGGFARIFVLPMPRRSSSSPVQVRLKPGERTLYLSVEAQRLTEPPEKRWRFQIVDAGDSVVWSMEATSSDIAALGSPELILAVPAQPLPAGALKLQVGSAGDPSDTPLEFPISLTPPSGE